MIEFDLIIDVNFPDHAALLYQSDGGEWVKAIEADDEIQFLKEALMNLRDCNIKHNSITDLNTYVNSVLEAAK